MIGRIAEFVSENPGLTVEELVDALSDMLDDDPDNLAWWVNRMIADGVLKQTINGHRLEVERADE